MLPAPPDCARPLANDCAAACSQDGCTDSTVGTTDDSGWIVNVASPPELPSKALALGGYLLSDFPLRTRLTADGSLHLLGERILGSEDYEGAAELVYVQRSATGESSAVSLAQGVREFVFERCGPPSTLGRRCTYTYETVRPFEIIANAAGDVRLYYTHNTAGADLTADCDAGNYSCRWVGSYFGSGELKIAFREGDGFSSALLTSDFNPSAASAIDDEGRLHLLTLGADGLHYQILGR